MDRFGKFMLAMSEIDRYWHRIAAKELSRFHLKGPHAIYLVALNNHPEGLTGPDLSKLLGKDKADISRMMAILEKRGLVLKDGEYRGLYVLTKEGKEISDIVSRKAETAVDKAGADLSDAERDSLYKSLDSIVRNLSRMNKEGIL